MDSISRSSAGRIAFGPFSLVSGERLLTKHGAPVEIGGRSLDLLIALVEQPGRVLSKHELLNRVWPDVIVEESSLRFHMAGLRKILGDGEDGARYIATQVGVGYAFVAPIQVLPRASSPASACQNEEQRRDSHSGADCSLPPRPRMVGRERDAQLLQGRIADVQLFTIVGPAGVGKTTLAIEIAHAAFSRFADKARFVDLGMLEDSALVPSAIAGALGIPVQAEDLLTVVLAHIRTQHMLLILDNCEHLMDAVPGIVERIRHAAPRISMLATSREPLRVHGEHVHWLEPLEYPRETTGLSLDQLLAYPAVELFIERASAGNSALGVDAESARMIAEMCRRLDGMALAIELTAVRVGAHGLHATSQLLGQRFSLGWTGRRTAVPRQQTLQATLDWSYDLLLEVERRTFERLAVFLGPFTLDAALDVVTDSSIDAETAAATLDELTAKSLVVPDRSAGGSSYRLLEMTRAYAKKRLLARGSDELNATARRHANFFLRELAIVDLGEGDFLEDAARFAQMLGNIRSALDWSFGSDGDISLAVPIAAASARVFLTLSLLIECRTWCERAIKHLNDRYLGTSTELELQAALGLSLMFTRGNLGAVEVALRRALEIATSLGDRRNQLRMLGRLHIFHERIGDFATAVNWAETAVQVANTMGEPEAIAVAASLAGISHHLAGDQTLARRELELSLRQSLPSDRGCTIYSGFDHRNRTGIALARTLWLQGYADQARRLAEQTVREAAGLDHPITHCIALIWTLSVYTWTGDLEKAEVTLETFANCAEVNALAPYIVASHGFRAELDIHRGNPDGAVGMLEDSLSRLTSARYELLTSTFELARARGLILSGRYDEALTRVGAAIDRCNENGELYAMPELLRIKANAARCAGDIRAEKWLHESLSLSRSQGARAWELRATIDLARLWSHAQRPAEARDLLRTIRDSFSEGSDTADLREADCLLRELSVRITGAGSPRRELTASHSK